MELVTAGSYALFGIVIVIIFLLMKKYIPLKEESTQYRLGIFLILLAIIYLLMDILRIFGEELTGGSICSFTIFVLLGTYLIYDYRYG